MKNIDSTTSEGMRLTTIMEFSNSDSESKVEDSSADFLDPFLIESRGRKATLTSVSNPERANV